VGLKCRFICKNHRDKAIYEEILGSWKGAIFKVVLMVSVESELVVKSVTPT
jgi:hypothetical protein